MTSFTYFNREREQNDKLKIANSFKKKPSIRVISKIRIIRLLWYVNGL